MTDDTLAELMHKSEASSGTERYWANLDRIVGTSRVTIDRPKGTAHPRIPEIIYPLDYGYLEGTVGGDRAEVDVFVGSDADAGVVAACVTADPIKRDVEVKVLIDCTPSEVLLVCKLLDDEFEVGALLVIRPQA